MHRTKTSVEPFAPVEAITAIDRSVILRLERNLRIAATFRTDHREHLTRFALSPVPGTAALVATVAAASRLIFEAFFRVKLLFPDGKDEIFAAVLAYQPLTLMVRRRRAHSAAALRRHRAIAQACTSTIVPRLGSRLTVSAEASSSSTPCPAIFIASFITESCRLCSVFA